MVKKISAGFIIHDDDNFLICHATNSNFFDIPKGLQEDGEFLIQTAIRECKEETNIDISEREHYDIIFEPNYSSHKSLALYGCYVNDLDVFIAFHNLKCSSTYNSFIDGIPVDLPEVDGYKIIPWNEYPLYLNDTLRKVFDKILNTSPTLIQKGE